MRADVYIKTRMGRSSRALVHRILDRGEIRMDGQPLPASKRLRGGEKLELWRIKPDDPSDLDGMWVEIIENHEDFLAINKPPGLAIHPTAKDLHKTLTYWLQVNYPNEPIHPCHRLDRETSGIILCAKNKKAESAIKKSFEQGLIKKTYAAVVRGDFPLPSSLSRAGGNPSDAVDPRIREGDRPLISDLRLLDTPLALQGNRGLIRTKMIHDVEGLPSETWVEKLHYDPIKDQTHLRCYPQTGRQHQIRVHLALAGFPIVGDKLYGMGEKFFDEYCRGVHDPALLEAPRHLLHAERIGFELNGVEHSIRSSPPWLK